MDGRLIIIGNKINIINLKKSYNYQDKQRITNNNKYISFYANKEFPIS